MSVSLMALGSKGRLASTREDWASERHAGWEGSIRHSNDFADLFAVPALVSA